MRKIVIYCLIFLIAITIIFTAKVDASHTSTNFVVNSLGLLPPATSPLNFVWTPSGSTLGRLFVGTNLGDPIVGSIASVAINTGTGSVSISGSFPNGTYAAAMYTGAFGEVLMSNVFLFTVGSAGVPPPTSSTGDLGRISPPPIGNIGTFTGAGGLQAVLRVVIQLMFIVGFIGAFIWLLIGAISWITSGGDPKIVGQARGRITACIIGLVILLSIFAIVNIIELVFGINILTTGIQIPRL